MPSVFSFPFSDGTWSITPSCPIMCLLGGGRGASDGWRLCTWLRGAVTSTVPCHLPASTVTCVRGPPGFPPPLSTPRALVGILPLGDSPCAQAGAWKQPSGRAHALTLTAGPALPCRRSFPSWLCPPRWPRASRSWTPIPAWASPASSSHLRSPLNPSCARPQEELPAILKHKKSLQKLVSDWNTLKSRLSQAAKNSGSGQGLGGGPGSYTTTANKAEMLKEEEEELKRKVEQCKDEYLADLYHFATKEDTYANYFIHLMEIQADYHRKSLSSLDTALAELRENHSQTDPSPSMMAAPFSRVYGMPLGTHLRELGRDIALPIEACVMMLLSESMKEEGLFRLAAGASVLKRLKQTMASDPCSLQEFCSDPHAVAGALKSYLRELPEPLMTFDLYDDWMRAASLKEPGARLEALQEVCSRLPRENLSNLRYLMKFLALLAEAQEVNKMTPSNIAIVLGPNLLWPPEKEGDLAQLDAASVSSIQVVGMVEALIQNADTLFPGDINFNVSGLFSAPAPQDKVSDRPASEELPSIATPTPAPVPALAPAPAPASVALKERAESEAPRRPASPKVSRSSLEAATPTEDMARRTKRPAPARPTMPPPQVSSTRGSPPAPPPPPGSGSPATPRALPRRLVGSSLRAPMVPPPLPPTAPQPARRQSRPPPASPSPASPGPVSLVPVSLSAPADVDLGAAAEEGGAPEAAGRAPTPPVIPPQPRPRSLASETD
ncbi:SH3 domain-binding protein 1 isoform X1 [Phocoena sinus]|uniref:SH3 domain-binding protein 1 isoform X1 n=1 Tax=Phocoena sinus TaxID=42100 RepID=UPI0013C46319|nr:SH3 domain-binding protein 1 isoform X1 [Phocoena sinus]